MTIPPGAVCILRVGGPMMTRPRRGGDPNKNRGSEDLMTTPKGGTAQKAQTKMADVVEW